MKTSFRLCRHGAMDLTGPSLSRHRADPCLHFGGRDGCENGSPIRPAFTISLGQRLGQCRAVPVELGADRGSALLVVYAADAVVDPYSEMVFIPERHAEVGTRRSGREHSLRRDLGKGVMPGSWFCPVFPFDMNADRVDEIYLVGNADSDHPLGQTGASWNGSTRSLARPAGSGLGRPITPTRGFLMLIGISSSAGMSRVGRCW